MAEWPQTDAVRYWNDLDAIDMLADLSGRIVGFGIAILAPYVPATANRMDYISPRMSGGPIESSMPATQTAHAPGNGQGGPQPRSGPDPESFRRCNRINDTGRAFERANVGRRILRN